MSKRKFAAFDIDGTVFRWQLYHELFDAFVENGIIDHEKGSDVLEARQRWQRRETDYESYEQSLVQIMMASVVGLEEQTFGRIADAILLEKGHRTYRYTLDLLKQLQHEGYVIIAISGSYQQLVDRFAKLHGIDIAVGREHVVVDGRLTAESRDIFGRKDEILQELVNEHGLTFGDSYAVGDSGGDIAMLEIVEHPIAFNPDAKLRKTAMQQGWDIVIERKSLAYKLSKGTDGSYILAETTSR